MLNVPNALSLSRLVSGPFIAMWILNDQWELALPALAVAAATDWADGWAARLLGQSSVLGSYLDPLADKALICSVVAALGMHGAMPSPVVAVILGRDAVLVAGAFGARAHALGWRWPGAAEFFRLQPAEAAPAGQGAAHSGGLGPVPAAPLVRPLFVSKVNTVLQLGLVAACMSRAWAGWPAEEALWAASAATAGTSVWSLGAYARLHGFAGGRAVNC